MDALALAARQEKPDFFLQLSAPQKTIKTNIWRVDTSRQGAWDYKLVIQLKNNLVFLRLCRRGANLRDAAPNELAGLTRVKHS